MLKGHTLVPAGQPFQHHLLAAARVAVVMALSGPARRSRDSARSCRGWFGPRRNVRRCRGERTAVGVELEVAGVFADEVDAAMDWLVGVARRSGKRMAKHLSREPSCRGWRRSNLSWSGMTGRGCALAVCGFPTVAGTALPQIEDGVLTDPAGRPVEVWSISADRRADHLSLTSSMSCAPNLG
ncbi:hypothetical protein A4G29_24940 [Mycobacterium kansasii]|nr:hypothetical protein A4G29_24940 [Mycobacterium kansasii]